MHGMERFMAGKSPLDFANENGHAEVIGLLSDK